MRLRLDRGWWKRGQRWESRRFHALAFVAWGFLVVGILFFGAWADSDGRQVATVGLVVMGIAHLGELYTRRRRARAD